MLQAESEKLRQAWIQAVQASIASAYREITDNYYIEVYSCYCKEHIRNKHKNKTVLAERRH